MPNERFSQLIDKFKGLNLLKSRENLDFGEFTSLADFVVEGDRLKLGYELGTADGAGTLPAVSTGRWMKFWADSQDKWYCVIAADDGTNTDLKFYSEATNPWDSLQTKTDLFLSDKVSTPDSFSVGGELRIGGSLTNYHKFIKWFPSDTSPLYRLGNTTGAAEDHAYIAAGLKMYKGEIEYPNQNSEIITLTPTSQDSGYDFLEGDTVEYGLTYTYDNAQESLMYTGYTDTSITAGQRVALALLVEPKATNALSWRVTHINIYRAVNDDDFYLLTTLQVNSPAAVADYGETKTGINWAWADGNDRGTLTVYDTGAVLVDSYTSRTGYPDFIAHDGTTEYLDDTLRAYFKTCTVCQGRTVIGNVRRYVGTDLETYNDRLYFSPVGKFDSFYKDDWIDLESGDGDEITALVSMGGKIAVFKENNMYIWNMGTRSELNWFKEASYRGYGVVAQKNVLSTPYGIAFAKSGGFYLYDGTGEPREITKNVRKTLATNIAVGYDTFNRRAIWFETSFFWLIDLDDGFISQQVSTTAVVSFDVYNNKPHILSLVGGTGTVYNINGTASLINPNFTTGRMNFGTNRNKRINRVRIKYLATSAASAVITFICGTENETGSVVVAESPTYTTIEFYPNVYGRYCYLALSVGNGVDTFEVPSIEISGKVYRV